MDWLYNLVARYYLARKVKSQALMNRYFHGTYWSLAERYTDMLKKTFVCFFFGWIVPSAYIITCVSMLVDYFMDNTYFFAGGGSPHYGHKLSVVNRVFLYYHMCGSRYNFVGIPTVAFQLRSVVFDGCKEKKSKQFLISRNCSANHRDQGTEAEQSWLHFLTALLILMSLLVFHHTIFSCVDLMS